MLLIAASTRLLRPRPGRAEAAAALESAGPRPAALEESARRLLDLGFERFLIDEDLKRPDWEGLRSFLPARSLAAAFLFAPRPPLGPARPPEVPRLSSLDADERREALKRGQKSLEFAARYEIPLILLPPAVLEAPEPEEVEKALEKTAAPRRLVGASEPPPWSRLWAKRNAAPSYAKQLDSWKGSLYRLLEIADRHAARIGLIPAGLPGELPDFPEIERAFAEFKGGPLEVCGDWVGWERYLRSEGPQAGDFLETFGDRLAGVLVHDGAGRERHLPPGEGDADPERWRPLAEKTDRERPWMLDFHCDRLDESLLALRERIEALARPKQAEGKRPSILDFS
ncbi:MAG: TIM barrel protein [Planctomycetes bacterium]|nr:TIM barrel protein [Planctomycetota bacterium]